MAGMTAFLLCLSSLLLIHESGYAQEDEIHISVDSTTLILNPISNVVNGTTVTVSGILVNTLTGQGISGATINFSTIDSSFSRAITGGIKFEHSIIGGIRIEFCSDCPPDNYALRDGIVHGNKVLKLDVDGVITFPENTSGVVLELNDMGKDTVEVEVQTAEATTFTAIAEGFAPDFALFSISSSDNISKITIKKINGLTDGSISIAAIRTFDFTATPQDQHYVDFESELVGSKTSPFSVNDGFFFSTSLAPAEPDKLVNVTAHFDGDEALGESSDSDPGYYRTLAATLAAGALGEGTYTDYVGNDFIIPRSCAVDTDKDYLCDDWETSGIPYSKPDGSTGYYSLCYYNEFAQPPGFTAPADNIVCANPNHLDIFVELDAMEFHIPNTDAVNDVIAAFANAPITYFPGTVTPQDPDAFGDSTGITLHVVTRDRGLEPDQISHLEEIKVFKDPVVSGYPYDTDHDNDFLSIKQRFFGTTQERDAFLSPTSSIIHDPINNQLSDDAIVVFTTSGIKINTAEATKGTTAVTTTVKFSDDPGTITVNSLRILPGTSSPELNVGAPSYSTSKTSATTRTITVKVPLSTTTAVEDMNLGTIEVKLKRTAGVSSITMNTAGPTDGSGDIRTPSPWVSTPLLQVKAQAFHYGLFAHSYGGPCGSSGLAEVPGNDFVVTLGCNFGDGHPGLVDPNPGDANNWSVGTREEQAGTLMHELGHNLNLHHGGPRTGVASTDYTMNCKPNHMSVMSYSRQVPTYFPDAATYRTHGLDYSRQSLADLVEQSSGSGMLNEVTGIANLDVNLYPSGQTIIWASPSMGSTMYNIEGAGPDIANTNWKYDFDATGLPLLQANVNEDINNNSILGCTGTGTTLKSYSEWDNLSYQLTGIGAFFDGAYPPFAPIQLPEITPGIYEEMRNQQVITVSASTPTTPPPSIIPPEFYWILIAILVLLAAILAILVYLIVRR